MEVLKLIINFKEKNKNLNDLNVWNMIPDSIFCHVETIKMFLPQFLFLFQTMPIPIPTSFFKQLNVTNFIWNNKSKRISQESINYSKKEYGGLAVPNLQSYFKHNTNTLVTWLRNKE